MSEGYQEYWSVGRLEEWKDGKVEDWKSGREEEWNPKAFGVEIGSGVVY